MQAQVLSTEDSNKMIVESLGDIGGKYVVRAPEESMRAAPAEMKILEGFSFGNKVSDGSTGTPSPVGSKRGKSLELLEVMRRSSVMKEDEKVTSEAETWVTGGEASLAGSVRPASAAAQSRRPTMATVPAWMQEETSPSPVTPPPAAREPSILPNLYPNENDDMMRDNAARDLEEYTAMIQNLWTDLKQWRQETKIVKPSDGKGGPLLLALRHMGYQIEAFNAIGNFQTRVACRLSTLALNATEDLPSHGPLATALRGERWMLGRATSIASSKLDMEDGYGDMTPVRNASGSRPQGMQVNEDGDMVMSLEELMKNVAPNEVTESIEKKRREMSEQVASLAQMVGDIKKREAETRDVHHARVSQLMKTVQALEGERDALLEAQKANKEKTEIYTQAFEDYRSNTNELRERCQVLTKENYDLRKAIQLSHGAMSTPQDRTLDVVLSPTNTRTPNPSTRYEETVDLEYEALSQGIESGLRGLGKKLVSPEIHAVESITPDYKVGEQTPTRIRSLSPWRYLPPTPQQHPPDYSPSASLPPFVKDSEPPPS